MPHFPICKLLLILSSSTKINNLFVKHFKTAESVVSFEGFIKFIDSRLLSGNIFHFWMPRFMTDLVTREMNLMNNTGGSELHEKIPQFFIILLSHIELSAALLFKVEANILLEIKSVLDNKKPIFCH